MRTPSELEAVDKASGDLRAIIGEDKGVSKSSSDSGLVNGLASTVEATAATGTAVLEAAAFTVALAVVGITVASAEAVEVGEALSRKRSNAPGRRHATQETREQVTEKVLHPRSPETKTARAPARRSPRPRRATIQQPQHCEEFGATCAYT